MHPQSPRRLVGGRWTRQGGGPLRHYEIVEFNSRAGTVRMRPALEPQAHLDIPWRDLRDRSRWLPNWVSIVSE